MPFQSFDKRESMPLSFRQSTFKRNKHTTKTSIVATEQVTKEELEMDQALTSLEMSEGSKDPMLLRGEEEDSITTSSISSSDDENDDNDDENDQPQPQQQQQQLRRNHSTRNVKQLNPKSTTPLKSAMKKSSTTTTLSSSTSSSSITSATTTRTKTFKPRIQFGQIEMRFYNRILGDNPACSNGAPIELDWTYNTQNIFQTSMEEYEKNRFPRRTRRQLIMTTVTRRNMMVHHFGCTHSDVDKAANSTKKIQRQREKTKSLSAAMEKRQEMTEQFTRVFRRRRSIGGGNYSSSTHSNGRDSMNHVMTLEQRRSVEAYENDHLSQILMVR